MNKRAKKIWERHYTALGQKFNPGRMSRINVARHKIEKLLRKG